MEHTASSFSSYQSNTKNQNKAVGYCKLPFSMKDKTYLFQISQMVICNIFALLFAVRSIIDHVSYV